MKRLFETGLVTLFLMIFVCACGKPAANEETGVVDMEIPQTGWTEAVPAEYHAYEGLSHGFGLGTGTVAEGWINDAVAFWEQQM